MSLSEHPEIATTASSLADKLGKPVSRPELLRELFFALEKNYLALKSGKSLYPEWRDNMSTIGKRIIVQAGDQVMEGTAESVSEDGSMLLRLSDGRLQRITIGDVSLREQKESG